MQNNWFNKERLVAGLMSGTSLDGVDAALVKFRKLDNGDFAFELIDHEVFPFDKDFRDSLFYLINQPISIGEISYFHHALTVYYSNAINELCDRNNIKSEDLDAVGTHGQTVWHEPIPKKRHTINVPSTFQIGSITALSAQLKTVVVGDFRSADIALGGQGAPLVPIFDMSFLSQKDRETIALNIGGIANIAYLPKDFDENKILAFDTGPGNALIDLAVQRFFNKEFDDNGDIAQSGKILERLMTALKKIAYISAAPPKSTGRELFNPSLLDSYLIMTDSINAEPNDIIRTLTEFTAWSIAKNIKNFANPESLIIVSGGGAHNKYLLKSLQERLPKSELTSSDKFGAPIDAKEAICFAYLAYRTLGDLHGNLPSVTGASSKIVLGSIAKCF